MLRNLRIDNFLLIEQADIEFSGGLCVLTGETGAGKSILLDALLFALGHKASSKLVRSGHNQASITAIFELSSVSQDIEQLLAEHELPFDNEIIIRRTISIDGRNKTFINDTPVGVTLLKKLGELLVEIHGQNEQSGLLQPDNHRLLLDLYGNLQNAVRSISATYKELSATKEQLNTLLAKQHNATQEADYLRHVINELEELAATQGEEAELTDKKVSLSNIGKVSETVNAALAELTNKHDVIKSLNNASRILGRSNLPHIDFSPINSYLDQASIEINEAIAALENKLPNAYDHEQTLEQIEERLYAIRAAARKHGCTCDQLPNYLSEIKTKLLELDNSENSIAKLVAQVEKLKAEYIKQATQLSQARQKAAGDLEKIVSKELAQLKMEKTTFKVAIDQLPEENWNYHGTDKVYFLASTNPGMPTEPINKIASGGELSRFMLALKVALHEVRSVPTLIFDEIDTGIGGAVSDALGNRLSLLSNNAQTIVITHQPQIAAKGNCHLYVTKKQDGTATSTIVISLSPEERKEELARMMSGQTITDEARAAAHKLLTA